MDRRWRSLRRTTARGTVWDKRTRCCICTRWVGCMCVYSLSLPVCLDCVVLAFSSGSLRTYFEVCPLLVPTCSRVQYALFYYDKAAALRPADARMWCAVGACLHKQFCRSQPVTYLTGSCHHRLDNEPAAIRCFERAVSCEDRQTTPVPSPLIPHLLVLSSLQ